MCQTETATVELTEEQRFLQDRLEYCDDNISRWQTYIKDEYELKAKLPARVHEHFQLVEKIRAAGFEPELNRYDYDIVIRCKKSDLLALSRLFGCTLEEYGKSLVDDNPKRRNRQVVVTRRPRKHKNVYVKFLTKLPPGVKCEIKTVRTTSRQLVCNL